MRLILDTILLNNFNCRAEQKKLDGKAEGEEEEEEEDEEEEVGKEEDEDAVEGDGEVDDTELPAELRMDEYDDDDEDDDELANYKDRGGDEEDDMAVRYACDHFFPFLFDNICIFFTI